MASSKSRPSKTPAASTAWKPDIILEIGEITDNFHCIGHTKHKTPCANPIKKEHRTRAAQILRSMSTTSPASIAFDDDDDKLAELSDILFCWRHKNDTQQRDGMMGKWTRAIEEFVRKSGDEVMGEANDTVASLDAEISDLMERRMRLVEQGRPRCKGEGRDAGYSPRRS